MYNRIFLCGQSPSSLSFLIKIHEQAESCISNIYNIVDCIFKVVYVSLVARHAR